MVFLRSGALFCMGNHRLRKRVMSGELRGGGERIDALRGRGSSAVWHHGGLEHRRT